MKLKNTIEILCVDDNSGFVDLTAEFLQQNNGQFSVATATSTHAGLEILSEVDIDCIVSDYEMPGMDGLEFLQAVRTTYPNLPFILFTGQGSEEIASNAISAGVTGYMQKQQGTDQYDVLAQRIQNAVSRHRTSRLLQDTIDTVNASIFVVDNEDRYLLLNQEARNLLEMGEKEEIVGKTNEELFSEELAAQFRGNNRRVFETESAVEFEQEVPTQFGGGTYLTRLTPLFDEQGEVYACCGIATEIPDEIGDHTGR